MSGTAIQAGGTRLPLPSDRSILSHEQPDAGKSHQVLQTMTAAYDRHVMMRTTKDMLNQAAEAPDGASAWFEHALTQTKNQSDQAADCSCSFPCVLSSILCYIILLNEEEENNFGGGLGGQLQENKNRCPTLERCSAIFAEAIDNPPYRLDDKAVDAMARVLAKEDGVGVDILTTHLKERARNQSCFKRLSRVRRFLSTSNRAQPSWRKTSDK